MSSILDERSPIFSRFHSPSLQTSTSCRTRPGQHRRATTLRRSHEMRCTVADWSRPNLPHNHGRGSSVQHPSLPDTVVIFKFATSFAPRRSSPTTPTVHLLPGIQSPPAFDADGLLTGFRPVDCTICDSPTFSLTVSRLPSFWVSLTASLFAPLFILISAADVRLPSSRSSRGTWPTRGSDPSVLASHLNDPWHVVCVQEGSGFVTDSSLAEGHGGHRQVPHGARPVVLLFYSGQRSHQQRVHQPEVRLHRAPVAHPRLAHEARRCRPHWRFQQGCRT